MRPSVRENLDPGSFDNIERSRDWRGCFGANFVLFTEGELGSAALKRDS